MDKKDLPLIIIIGILVIFFWNIVEFLGLVEPAPEQPPVVLDTVTYDSLSNIQAQDRALALNDSINNSNNNTQPRELETSASDEQILLDTMQVDTVKVETNKYIVQLSNHGGGPVSIILKDHTYRDGNPIEMLPGNKVSVPDFIFGNNSFKTSQKFFVSSAQRKSYTISSDTLKIFYTYQNDAGATLNKRYTFYPNEYHYDLNLDISDNAAFRFERYYDIEYNASPGVTEPVPSTDYEAMEVAAMQAGSRVKLDDYENDELDQLQDGSTTWAGVRSKYFASVIIPQETQAEAVYAKGRQFSIPTIDGDEIDAKELIGGMRMPVGAYGGQADSFRVFVGPLDYNLMSKYEVELEAMLDIGTTPFVGWLIKPFAIAIIWILPKLYNFFPNYGLVIIIFALLVKILTLPLSMKSFKSMNAMKELQPKIEKLKEKFKKDPKQMQQATMKLYKDHGVNPMSGCLPMLPQMPLFFALFSVFRSTILLRDAPFIWFIDDLSRGAASFTDPYIILVIIMVATQFISQKFTMAANTQNKGLMYMMPLFMGFIFYKFAAGLVLYWTCFSLFSLIDYFLFKRNKMNEHVKAA